MIETIFKKLLEKKIVKLSKIEESFFLYKKLDKKLKLTPEIITLNYVKESPYSEKQSKITSIPDYPNLYLWFHKDIEKQRYIPEALLLFRILVLEHENRIFVITAAIDKALIIKDGVLIASFAKKDIQKSDIVLMKDEYFLNKVSTLTEQQYQKVLQDSFRYLKYSDLLNILDVTIDIKAIMNRVIQWSAIPLLISAILLMSIIGGYDFYKKNENRRLLDIYKNSKVATIEMKNSIDEHEVFNELFNSLADEFRNVDKVVALSRIMKTTEDMNMTMQYIRIYDSSVEFIIHSKDAGEIPIYIKKLFKSNLFEDVKNISSQKLKDQTTKATMHAKLKER